MEELNVLFLFKSYSLKFLHILTEF